MPSLSNFYSARPWEQKRLEQAAIEPFQTGAKRQIAFPSPCPCGAKTRQCCWPWPKSFAPTFNAHEPCARRRAHRHGKRDTPSPQSVSPANTPFQPAACARAGRECSSGICPPWHDPAMSPGAVWIHPPSVFPLDLSYHTRQITRPRIPCQWEHLPPLPPPSYCFPFGAQAQDHHTDSNSRRTPLLFGWQFPMPDLHWTLTNKTVCPAGRGTIGRLSSRPSLVCSKGTGGRNAAVPSRSSAHGPSSAILCR
jgi:hypothetical protein